LRNRNRLSKERKILGEKKETGRGGNSLKTQRNILGGNVLPKKKMNQAIAEKYEKRSARSLWGEGEKRAPDACNSKGDSNKKIGPRTEKVYSLG